LVVVSLDFGRASEAKHPAAERRTWRRACATCAPTRGGSGVDPRRVGLVGSSSGAQLALLAGLQARRARVRGYGPIVSPGGALDAGPGDESVAFVPGALSGRRPARALRYVVGRQNDGSGFDAARLIAPTTVLPERGRRWPRRAWTAHCDGPRDPGAPAGVLAHPELDDNVPAAITDAFVQAYQQAGGFDRTRPFPGPPVTASSARRKYRHRQHSHLDDA